MTLALLILAYNEEQKIKEVVKKYIKNFEKVIVVNDCSKDSTSQILNELNVSYDNLNLIENEKNLGAGKSFEIGMQEFINSDCKYLIKIDGDDQFNHKDINKLMDFVNKEHFDYIKCDRFWSSGIDGKIPFVRYLGNAFASFLIKFATGNWRMNDALNGLFLISKRLAKEFSLPKLFNRYGYPFYLNSFVCNFLITNDIKIAQYQNTVSYRDEKSNLNAFTMFFKLVYFVIKNFFKKIKLKIQVSKLQISAIFDIFSIVLLFNTLFSIYKFVSIRYYNMPGQQGTWFVVLLFFIFIYILILVLSQNQESKLYKNNFLNIK